jgi:DNA-binding transcriptional LysR family regulator
MALNLHHLRIFAAVLEHRGFTRASAALHLSQPAVSKAVRELERHTGMRLLERGTRSLAPTDAGALLYERARELFGAERAAEEDLRALRGLERGRLHVAASTTIATYLLPPLLARFHAAHPGIRLRVTSVNTRRVARLLVDRRADIALVEGPVDHPRIEVHPWRDDELVVVVPAAHPLAQRRRPPLAALAGVPFIVRERGSGTRVVAEAALAAQGFTPSETIELGGNEAITRAVAAGLGVTIISRVAVDDQVALGRVAIVRVAGLDIRRTFTELRLRDAGAGSDATRRWRELSAIA